MDAINQQPAKNVLGTTLVICSESPMTGFFRDGCCNTCPDDLGQHTVCAQVDEAFLRFTATRGNDLASARPEFGFPGLKPGDYWCLCLPRWLEALDMGCAPKILLESTHESVLQTVPLQQLKPYGIKQSD